MGTADGFCRLNEKIRVQSLYEGRDFLEAIVRDYARQ